MEDPRLIDRLILWFVIVLTVVCIVLSFILWSFLPIVALAAFFLLMFALSLINAAVFGPMMFLLSRLFGGKRG